MPEEDVAEPGPAHEGRERRPVARDGRGHALHQIVDVVETGVDDRAAERLEPADVQRDVVVDEEDGPRAVVPRVADVGQDPLERVGVEVASAHLDDRAEAAVERAAA